MGAADKPLDGAGLAVVNGIISGRYVPNSRKINGKALSADISLTASDVGARPSTWTPTAANVGAVPTGRKVNGKPLSADISLTASDVGAAAMSQVNAAVTVMGETKQDKLTGAAGHVVGFNTQGQAGAIPGFKITYEAETKTVKIGGAV